MNQQLLLRIPKETQYALYLLDNSIEFMYLTEIGIAGIFIEEGNARFRRSSPLYGDKAVLMV